jgi:hypothetical protein
MMDKIPGEILHQIIYYGFKNSPEERLLLLVNTEWFEYGISHVWSRAKSSNLLKVPDHRRQLYASLISKLEVDAHEDKINRQLVNLEFPQSLTYSSIARSRSHTEDALAL